MIIVPLPFMMLLGHSIAFGFKWDSEAMLKKTTLGPRAVRVAGAGAFPFLGVDLPKVFVSMRSAGE